MPALIAPAIVILLAVTGIPLAIGFLLSFTDTSLLRPGEWQPVGLDNYTTLFQDPKLPSVLRNTIALVTAIVVIETGTGLVLALLLERKIRGIGLVRSIYFLPLMTTSIVVVITWRALFNANSGWINYFLGLIGLPEPNWLGDPDIALWSITLADVWVGTPFMAILILAGLLAVSQELKEAAAVDGASSLRVFRHITLPAIGPILAIAILFRTVDAFRKFESVSVMTGGGPGDATTILNLYVYQVSFLFYKLGYGATLAIVLVAMMGVAATVIYRRTVRT